MMIFPPGVDHIVTELPSGDQVHVRLHTAGPDRHAEQGERGWPKTEPTVTHTSYWTEPTGGSQVEPVVDAATGTIIGWVFVE